MYALIVLQGHICYTHGLNSFLVDPKVEGTITNIPPIRNTYERLPIANTSTTILNRFHGVTGSSVITSTTLYRPPLSSHKVGRGFHFMLDQFKMGLELLVTADFANLFTGKGGGL